jgi:hypothetical protein
MRERSTTAASRSERSAGQNSCRFVAVAAATSEMASAVVIDRGYPGWLMTRTKPF